MRSSTTTRTRVVRRLGIEACLILLAWLAAGCLAGTVAVASPRPSTKAVGYHGYTVSVPAAWRVYNLGADPHVCVRFDRHAVYLGQPGSQQNCPAHAVGRTEAILVEPGSGSVAATAAARAVPSVAEPRAQGPEPSSGQLTIRTHDVTVTATWQHQPATVERALGVGRLPAPLTMPAPAQWAPIRHAARMTRAAASAKPGQFGDPLYTGLGFDACATPSLSQMRAWSASPYRAAGVYIGGANMACAQPNLTAAWLGSVIGGGWHVVPIYVGLQAPANSCGCAPIAGGQAAAEGAAAATDAIAHAEAIGIGSGNTIYYDMEAYKTGGATSATVTTFLSAWTAQLHAAGYASGIYSSGASGVKDLVARYGTSYREPDAIWFAAWNGQATTSTTYIPAGDWSNHQRLHQYSGGVNSTYGGVKLNIDRDYVDAPTVGAAVAAAVAAPPQATAPPSISGSPTVAQTVTERHGHWTGTPTSYTYQWERCASSGGACSIIPGATAQRYMPATADLGHTLRVSESARNARGAGMPTSSAAALVRGGSYWLYTAYGNVYHSTGARWYGSPRGAGETAVTGMARTPTAHGYWVVTSAGRVYAYGDAVSVSVPPLPHRIRGIVADPAGGYWLYTAYGNVYHRGRAGGYGSPLSGHVRTNSIVGMASTPTGHGYWLVTSAGRVYAYGDAAVRPSLRHSYPIDGIVS